MIINPNSYKICRVEKINEETQGFKTFRFFNDHGLQWKAVQYLTLVRQVGGEELRRSYSITTSFELGEPLTIGVRRMENGIFSRWLVDTIKEGDELLTIGTGGFFTLPGDIEKYRQIFFFAAGSGITPIFSLIKTTLHQYPSLKIVLIYSNASIDKTVFLQPLNKLQRQFPAQFSIEYLFSNHWDLRLARLNRDLLLDLVNRYSISSFDTTVFYTCGPESYMRLCTFVLQEQGVPKENIRRENFVTHKSTAPVYPPDQRKQDVHIHFHGDDLVINVDYPDSVLKAAKKQGISLPYSCEAGQCGNCVAVCTKGKIWHSNNEVLTDKDLENGLVLTCVGHPVGGDVHLEIK